MYRKNIPDHFYINVLEIVKEINEKELKNIINENLHIDEVIGKNKTLKEILFRSFKYIEE